jgi:gas vesicle protein
MSANKILAAIATGIAIGILIAPAKGTETRRKISDKVDDASDYLKDVVEKFRNQANEMADQSIDKIERAESQINDALQS